MTHTFARTTLPPIGRVAADEVRSREQERKYSATAERGVAPPHAPTRPEILTRRESWMPFWVGFGS
ncbi:MAG: hypothetical protein ACI841_004561, partial [Planctomycetota bacterium]